MADVKISGLPASTVPLAGTEVLPIVQGGATKQVSIANVTAGRVIAASGVTTDTYKAASSAGGTLQANNATACLQWGAGGGSGLIFDGGVSSTAANAAIVFSPTGTGTVAISPAGALTINPTAASTINNVAIGGTTPLAGKFTNAVITNDPSTIWGLDFASGGSASNLVTIASGATYDLASGSGVVYLWENGGNGVGVFYTYYGVVNISFQNGALYTVVSGTPATVNVFFNAGTAKYRIQNNSAGALQFYISTICLRDAV
jgi:hypothetical protein